MSGTPPLAVDFLIVGVGILLPLIGIRLRLAIQQRAEAVPLVFEELGSDLTP